MRAPFHSVGECCDGVLDDVLGIAKKPCPLDIGIGLKLSTLTRVGIEDESWVRKTDPTIKVVSIMRKSADDCVGELSSRARQSLASAVEEESMRTADSLTRLAYRGTFEPNHSKNAHQPVSPITACNGHASTRPWATAVCGSPSLSPSVSSPLRST